MNNCSQTPPLASISPRSTNLPNCPNQVEDSHHDQPLRNLDNQEIAYRHFDFSSRTPSDLGSLQNHNKSSLAYYQNPYKMILIATEYSRNRSSDHMSQPSHSNDISDPLSQSALTENIETHDSALSSQNIFTKAREPIENKSNMRIVSPNQNSDHSGFIDQFNTKSQPNQSLSFHRQSPINHPLSDDQGKPIDQSTHHLKTEDSEQLFKEAQRDPSNPKDHKNDPSKNPPDKPKKRDDCCC